MHVQRLGRAGPLLSAIGVRGPAPASFLSTAAAVGINWLVLDLRAGGADAAATSSVPPDWSLLLIGADAARAAAVLRRVERPAADVAFAAGEADWPAAVALVAAGLARCAGLVTDDAASVEACRTDRHVDAVWTAEPPDPSLVQVCRWSGTGLLVAADTIGPPDVPGPTGGRSGAAD